MKIPLLLAGLLALFWAAQAGYPWPTNVTQVHGYIEVRHVGQVRISKLYYPKPVSS